MENIDFLFIGGIIPKEIQKEIINKSKKGIQLAANNFQWSLINGFDSNLFEPINIMNIMFIGSYPNNFEDYIIHQKLFSHTTGAKDISLGFLNLTIIKQFIRPFGEKSFLKQWVIKDKDKIKVIFIYSLHPRFVRIAKLIKKYNPNVYICISVNDLPQYVMLGKRGIVCRVQKAITQKIVENGLKYIDGYMLVTEQIAQELGISNKPHVVVEALVNTSDEINYKKHIEDKKNKTVVYTGGLTEKYGLLDLIKAFMKIESKEYKLIICGDGETKKDILEAMKIDKRIEYLGVLPPNEVRIIQQSATVLINPRKNINDFTKFSFPIKTIEYLLAGVPVIGYRLSGIPKEYDNYLIYVEEDSIEALRDKIIEVCNIPYDQRLNIGIKNRQFVLDNKNHKVQTKRILDMIMQGNNLNKK